MTQFSPYFDGEKRKTTWSPTYQRIFRSFYPDGSWKDMEKDAEPTAKPLVAGIRSCGYEMKSALSES